jgi:hypothetical protein
MLQCIELPFGLFVRNSVAFIWPLAIVASVLNNSQPLNANA